MEEEGVSLHEPEAEQVVEQMIEEAPEPQEEVREPVEKQVPLSALQKERKKRQELEMQIEYERQQRYAQAPQEEDDGSRYESATKEDLHNVQFNAIRAVEEKSWTKTNPEKYEEVMENLSEFLKQRPNLAHAINSATNRYEEAWTLMSALTPKQKQQLKSPPLKKDAPNSPGGIPKATAMNHAVDVMSMSDQEFSEWRKSKKRR